MAIVHQTFEKVFTPGIVRETVVARFYDTNSNSPPGITSQKLEGKFIGAAYYYYTQGKYRDQWLAMSGDEPSGSGIITSTFVYAGVTYTKEIPFRIAHVAPVISWVATQYWPKGSAVDLSVNITNSPDFVEVTGLLIGLKYEKTDTGVRIYGTVQNVSFGYGNTSGTVTILAQNGQDQHKRTFTFTGIS